LAELGQCAHVVADEQDGAAVAAGDLLHLAEALLLEGEVADGEDLVDDQDVGLQVGGHGEGQADVHPGGIALHRRVEELLDLGEGDDLVELAIDLGLLHPEDRAVEVDVLAAAELGMEPGADLQERGEPAAEPGDPARRLDDPAEDLQQRGLPRAVPADEPDDLASPDLEGDVLEGPEGGSGRSVPRPGCPQDLQPGSHRVGDGIAQRVRGPAPGAHMLVSTQIVTFADAITYDDWPAHGR
jgi:hypothetical protein